MDSFGDAWRSRALNPPRAKARVTGNAARPGPRGRIRGWIDFGDEGFCVIGFITTSDAVNLRIMIFTSCSICLSRPGQSLQTNHPKKITPPLKCSETCPLSKDFILSKNETKIRRREIEASTRKFFGSTKSVKNTMCKPHIDSPRKEQTTPCVFFIIFIIFIRLNPNCFTLFRSLPIYSNSTGKYWTTLSEKFDETNCPLDAPVPWARVSEPTTPEVRGGLLAVRRPTDFCSSVVGIRIGAEFMTEFSGPFSWISLHFRQDVVLMPLLGPRALVTFWIW